MFRTTLHRQVAFALALVALALTGAVAGVAVAQTDVSTFENGSSAVESSNSTAENTTVTITHDGPLVLRSAPNQTVSVESNASPGTELSVTLRSTKFNLLMSSRVTVSEDGTGTAAFDLSDVGPGVTFSVTAGADTDAEVSGIVVNESATVHRDGTFVPAETDSNVTIRGRVMDPAVTKLDVRVAPAGDAAAQNQTVTVGETRRFSAEFDLSSVSADTEVSVEAGGIPRSVTSVVVTEEGRAPTVYAFVETLPNATIRYPQETVLVHPAENQTVHGETNLRPGTELTVEAVRDERNSPDDFTRTANVTVGENGRFAADLNFSGIEPDTNFSLRVGRGLAIEDGRVVNESVALPTVTTTETETTANDTDIPGFGVSIAVAALLAGLALARRS
jgi:PGF-CTERM protein